MKTLKKTIKKNGFLYTQVKRTDKVAMYEQMEYGYEVFKVLIRKPGRFNTEYREKFPCNEDFGNTAWSFGFFSDKAMALDRANAKFDLLCQSIAPTSELK